MKKFALALAVAGATGLAVSSLMAGPADQASPIFGVKFQPVTANGK